MKLLGFTDLHLDPSDPVSRTDSYYATTFAELAWVIAQAKELDVRAILFSGDFFDRPVQPDHVKCDVIDLLKQAGIEMYVVPGQHDVSGYNTDSYRNKSIGPLESAGVIKVLQHGDGVVLDDMVTIRGY